MIIFETSTENRCLFNKKVKILQTKNKLKRTMHSFKINIYEWRYWDNIYRKMKENKKVVNVKENSQLIPYINKPGIAFSIDDSYRVDHWYEYGKDLFGYYDVKVTFNVNGFHPFEGKRTHNQKEIDRLLELQANGHEIAHHGFKHQRAINYSDEFGLKKWVEDDIVSLFNWLEKQSHSITNEKFKRPITFAFPHFRYTDAIVNEIVPEYFKIVRGHINGSNLTPFNHVGFAPSICIDHNYLKNVGNIKKVIKMAKRLGSNLILTCHSILPDEVNWEKFGWGKEASNDSNWRISPRTIQAIINEARKQDMEFYRTSEIVGVASFIDHNFERCIRKVIKNSSEKWISISELIPIKELDLSNQNISNLDGIQYFLNLEKLNISHNHITDLRLLEKLPKLKSVDINHNPIKREINLKAAAEI